MEVLGARLGERASLLPHALIDGPLNQAVEVARMPTNAGAVKFGCAMETMIGGVLLVE